MDKPTLPDAADWLRVSRGEAGQPFLRVHVVQIFVADQDRSVRFYVEQLGFQLLIDVELPSGIRWIVVAPSDGSAGLALVKPGHDSEEYKPIGGWTGVTFITENIMAKFEEWSHRNVHFIHPPMAPSWGSGQARFAHFQDIDGNRFNLLEVDEMTRALEAERRAAEERLEAERRAAQEMTIAREVQSRLFPQRLPPLDELAYAGVCLPAREVGGDYYDFLDFGPGRLGLVVGDVAGKGIAVALLMANLQANLRSQYAVALHNLESLLTSVNKLFYENTPEASYTTLFFADYQERNGRIRYANCGHLPPLLLHRDNSIERLMATSTVLGIFGDWKFAVADVQLAPGDTMVLYTDGVTEAR